MTDAILDGSRITSRSIAVVIAASSFYLLLSIFLIGFKTDQLVLIGIFNSLFFLSSITRKFITGFSIFIVFWIIFDFMKAFPNYHYNAVHIADVYNVEKHLFGIRINGQLLTPNEYWRTHGFTFLDVITASFISAGYQYLLGSLYIFSSKTGNSFFIFR